MTSNREITKSIFYARSSKGRLRQGEILTNVLQTKVSCDSLKDPQPIIETVEHPFAVVLSQDCDLEQDWNARPSLESSDKLAKEKAKIQTLTSILLVEAVEADKLTERIDFDKRLKDRFIKNKDERYQFLSAVKPQEDLEDLGIPAIGLDFKRYFSMPVDEIYKRIEDETKKRATLQTPYAEQLSSRFYYFQSRIGTEKQHHESDAS